MMAIAVPVTMALAAAGAQKAQQAAAPPTQDKAAQTTTATGYTCPLNGEELPCPNCCPLNK